MGFPAWQACETVALGVKANSLRIRHRLTHAPLKTSFDFSKPTGPTPGCQRCPRHHSSSPSPAPWKRPRQDRPRLYNVSYGGPHSQEGHSTVKWQFPAGWDKVGNMRRPGTGGWPQHSPLLRCTLTTPQHGMYIRHVHTCCAWPGRTTRTLHGYIASTPSVGCLAQGPPQPRLPDLIMQ